MTEQDQPKLGYERPKVVDYGTLLELTKHGGPHWPLPWGGGDPGHQGPYPPS